MATVGLGCSIIGPAFAAADPIVGAILQAAGNCSRLTP